PLWEIVSADALRAIAGADLLAPRIGARRVARLALGLVKAGPQHRHRLRPVLVLALHAGYHHDAGWDMREAHRRVRGVDVLAAGAGRAHRIDADVFGLDVDVDLFDLGQYGDRRGGGVDAARRLGLGDALHAMHAGLVFEPRIGALARDVGDHFLVAAGVAVAGFHDAEFPALEVGIALVHAQQVAGEQRRLVAAGPGAHFQNDVLFVGRVLGQEQDADVLLHLGDLRPQLADLSRGHLGHVLVGGAGKLLGR